MASIRELVFVFTPGLTAVRSVEMKKLMREDYPEKWALFRVAMQEKERLKKLKYKENKAIKDKERREMMKERAALHLATEVEFAEYVFTLFCLTLFHS